MALLAAFVGVARTSGGRADAGTRGGDLTRGTQERKVCLGLHVVESDGDTEMDTERDAERDA
jgi:hypothetical protein